MRDYKLYIQSSSSDLREFPISKDAVKIGRRSTNDIVLDDEAVSRFHAEITWSDGNYYIEDKKSSNGTFVNGSKATRKILKAGDIIEIGNNKIFFEVKKPPDAKEHQFFQKGMACSERGKWAEAAALFERAIEVSPDFAQAYFNRGKAYSELKKLDEAIISYEKGLMLSPADLRVLVEVGAIYERKGNWNKALNYYEKARKTDPSNQNVQKALLKIKEKMRVYEKLHTVVFAKPGDTKVLIGKDDLVTLSSDHFRIQFSIAKDISLIKKVLKTLKRAYKRVGGHLHYYPKKIPVIMYPSKGELKKAANKGKELKSWIAGFYDGIIRIDSSDETLFEPEFLYIVLTHEYAHLVVEYMSLGNCPYWLNEGIAQNEAQNLPKGSELLLRMALKKDALVPLELLEVDFQSLEDRNLIKLAYVESYSAVDYLIRKYRWSGIRRVMETLQNGRNMGEAFGSLGTSYSLFEKGWHDWLQKTPMSFG